MEGMGEIYISYHIAWKGVKGGGGHIYFLSYSNSHFSQVLEDGSLGKGFGYYLKKSKTGWSGPG